MPFRHPLVLSLLLTAFTSGAVLAASDTQQNVKAKHRRIEAQKPHVARVRQPPSCTQFGPGFVRMAGSDTCISINGAIDVGAGVGPGR